MKKSNPPGPPAPPHHELGGTPVACPPRSVLDYVRAQQAGDQPPKNPLFDHARAHVDRVAAARASALEEYICAHRRPAPDPKLGPFVPYLLIRSMPGDFGTRPLTGTPAGGWYDSPDIWFAEGVPAATPEIPPAPQPTDRLKFNHDYTVYAHVWNLGRSPVGRALVEFLAWGHHMDSALQGPEPPLDPSQAQRIGAAWVDLPPRTSLQCHKLVKCPEPLHVVPQGGPQHHMVILARISSFADPMTSPLDSQLDRHVARRDINYHNFH